MSSRLVLKIRQQPVQTRQSTNNERGKLTNSNEKRINAQMNE
jgi:hypothetical protein